MSISWNGICWKMVGGLFHIPAEKHGFYALPFVIPDMVFCFQPSDSSMDQSTLKKTIPSTALLS